MESKFGRSNVFKNIAWKLFERGSSLIVTFVINIVLARLLEPSDFGLAAMIVIFITLSTIFVTGGPANALIQKMNVDELDFSSIFWLNLIISVFLYMLIFMLARGISKFYGYPQLAIMLRVLGLNLIFSAINSIQGAYIARNMMFRYYFYSTLSSKIGSGIIGIGMAFAGFGVWSLIGQSLSLLLFETIILWSRVKWRPRGIFSWQRVRILYAFAWKIMIMTFVEAISDQLRKMLIGKKFASEDLAYYDKGFLFPTNIITNIASSLSAVMFPVLANSQDKNIRVLELCRRWTGLFAYCALPLLTGMIIMARSVIIVMLTEKWLPSTLYMQMACLVYAAWIIEIPIRETIKSLGFANICLRMQIIKTMAALLALLFLMNHGVMAIALSAVGCGLFNIGVSVFYGNKYIGYAPMMLFKDIVFTLGLNTVMALCIYTVTFLDISMILTIFLQVFLGGLVYICVSFLTKNENFFYIIGTGKNLHIFHKNR